MIDPKDSLRLEQWGMDMDAQLILEEAGKKAIGSGPNADGCSDPVLLWNTSVVLAHFVDGTCDFIYANLLENEQMRDTAYANRELGFNVEQ